MKKDKKVLFIVGILILIIMIFIYFKNNTYEVKFYSDGNVYETIDIRKNRPMKRPENPLKDGYVFLGWYDESGNIWNFNTSVSKNMNLVAHWGQIVKE